MACAAVGVAECGRHMRKRSVPTTGFDLERFLRPARRSKQVRTYASSDVIFQQGQPCPDVLYIQSGTVKLAAVSQSGREGVVAMLGRGDFFGEGCLAGQTVRIATATAMADTRVLSVPKATMIRLLHEEHEFSDRFLAHMLARNIRIEEDLIDHLFNSSEKRLARTLLLLARYGKQGEPSRALPRLSQEVLAGMIGTTRARVSFFMNKFRRLGFIEYNGGLIVHNSLLSVVLHDSP